MNINRKKQTVLRFLPDWFGRNVLVSNKLQLAILGRPNLLKRSISIVEFNLFAEGGVAPNPPELGTTIIAGVGCHTHR